MRYHWGAWNELFTEWPSQNQSPETEHSRASPRRSGGRTSSAFDHPGGGTRDLVGDSRLGGEGAVLHWGQELETCSKNLVHRESRCEIHAARRKSCESRSRWRASPCRPRRLPTRRWELGVPPSAFAAWRAGKRPPTRGISLPVTDGDRRL